MQKLDDVSLESRVDRLTLGAGRLEAPGAEPRAPVALRRIIAAIDGSESTANVLAWARRLAGLDAGRVDLITVVQPGYTLESHAGLLSWKIDAPSERREERRAREILESGTRDLSQSGVVADATLAKGSPAREIRRLAEFKGADIVVVGSHGHGPMRRVLLGSVADSLRSSLPASLLIVRGPPTPRRILIPVDGSRASLVSAALGVRLARAWRTPAEMLHVVEPPFSTASEGRDAIDLGLGAAAIFEDDPLVRSALEFGPAVGGILDHAAEGGFDLIVVGSLGLGGAESARIGSVASGVAVHATASVLLAHGGTR